jgi:hypothetical protein
VVLALPRQQQDLLARHHDYHMPQQLQVRLVSV